MPRKIKALSVVAAVLVLLITLWGIGLGMGGKTRANEQTGLLQDFDLRGTQAVFAYSSNGRIGIYTSDTAGKNVTRLIEAEGEQVLHHPVFSPDGEKIIYISTPKDREQQKSALYSINADGSGNRQLYAVDALITEVIFAPDGQSIYYLRADTFTNYSPIARRDAHDFDVYSLSLAGGEPKRITNMKDYMLEALSISPDGKELYVTRGDDQHVTKPEDTFTVKNKVFRIPLSNPNDRMAITLSGITEDVYDAAFSKDGRWMVFNSIANTGANGNFQYELYIQDRESGQVRQLTHLGRHAGAAVVDDKNEWIYFMWDGNFAKGSPVYEWYRVSLHTNKVESIPLAIEADQ